MSSEKILTNMETIFMALADKTRLRLLNLMRREEICVCFFTEVLGESQPKISRHLAYLRNAGIVEARREGKWMHYKIIEPEDENAVRILQDTLKWLASQDELQKEYERLVDVICCAVEVPVTIERAPKPETFAETNMSSEYNRELETFLL